LSETVHQVHREKHGRYLTLLCTCGWTVRGITPRHAPGYERIHQVSGLTNDPPQPACELGQLGEAPTPRPAVVSHEPADQGTLPSDW
jgi:hypothetical protein